MPVQSSWRYTRGTDSVRIDVREEGTAFLLIVSGPGPHAMSEACADSWGVMKAQLAYEAHLVAQGFVAADSDDASPDSSRALA